MPQKAYKALITLALAVTAGALFVATPAFAQTETGVVGTLPDPLSCNGTTCTTFGLIHADSLAIYVYNEDIAAIHGSVAGDAVEFEVLDFELAFNIMPAGSAGGGDPGDDFTEITEDYDDDLKVGPGEKVKIVGVEVDGDVKVNGGNLVLIEGAVIDGKIELKNGACLTVTEGSVIKKGVKGKDSSVAILDLSKVSKSVKAKKGPLQITIEDSRIKKSVKNNEEGGNTSITNSVIQKGLETFDNGTVELLASTVLKDVEIYNSDIVNVQDNLITGDLFVEGFNGGTVANNTVFGAVCVDPIAAH